MLAGVAALSATGALYLAGYAAPTTLYPFFSKEYHRYTHMPADMLKESAPKAMQKFMQTKLSRHIVRHHMGHHDDDTVNFNLMPGADYLRGVSKKATVAQEEELRRLKVLW